MSSSVRHVKNVGWVLVAVCGLGVSAVVFNRAPVARPIAATTTPAPKDTTALRQSMSKLESEMEALRKLVPGQSVAMLGVAQQFTGLWHAVEHRNWALAAFFLEETVEAIEWAVRIEPKHETPAGDVDLPAIFDALEQTLVPELKGSIEAKDPKRFGQAYRHMLEGCYACHKAVGKPYLRTRIPPDGAISIINFDLEATWPR